VLESPDMSALKLFLASNSPRRRELLALGGWEYTIAPAQVDEHPLPGEEGPDYVQRLAQSKACAVASLAGVKGVVIAADTTVVDAWTGSGTKIMGKPSDKTEALDMLQRLRGHVHQVYTAVSVLRTLDDTLLTDLCTTDVAMRNYSAEEMEAYIASGDPMDKAGAYAIQHAGFHPVETLQGCFANVMGLPLCHLTRTLHKLGVTPHADVPRACQTALAYDCPVYYQVLNETPQAVLNG
jgi:nucleoside triphosphate pyrophosphatase